MNCVVVIPVGPGHGRLSIRAFASVQDAWAQNPGPFRELQTVLVDDMDGTLGRSRARNQGLDDNPADWHFLLDADDEMMPRAFGLASMTHPATFGAICLNGKVTLANRAKVTRETLLSYGARGTLSMGCFLYGNLGLRFDESLDIGEDFDFYLRLPGFLKVREPLVSIGYDQPSAGGPRGLASEGWVEACDRVVERYRTTEVAR